MGTGVDPKNNMTVLHCSSGRIQCANIAPRMMTGNKLHETQHFVLQCHHTSTECWLTIVQGHAQKTLVFHTGRMQTVKRLFEIAHYHLNSGFAIVAFSPQVVCAV